MTAKRRTIAIRADGFLQENAISYVLEQRLARCNHSSLQLPQHPIQFQRQHWLGQAAYESCSTRESCVGGYEPFCDCQQGDAPNATLKMRAQLACELIAVHVG
jgi:hypothetical protein